MGLCPEHGPMTCRRCWASNCEAQYFGSFKLVHDPGHWGASDPATLVLGISKGNTQSTAYSSAPFDEVAFKDIRDRLLEIFQSVGILAGERIIEFEKRFRETENDFAFASVVRCSLTGLDRKKSELAEKDIYTADSSNVVPAFRLHSKGYHVTSNCVDQHLVSLAPRTRLILLLGNTDGYMRSLRTLIAAKRGGVTPINKVAYWSNGVKFVHLTHPSRGNGYFGAFVRGEGTSGKKRDLAKDALHETP